MALLGYRNTSSRKTKICKRHFSKRRRCDHRLAHPEGERSEPGRVGSLQNEFERRRCGTETPTSIRMDEYAAPWPPRIVRFEMPAAAAQSALSNYIKREPVP